ncbi:GCN5-related N-acetyltransferase [Mollisia scopiformis]|uniref:GCN5-related N-acetyltransferase n=1 Tax=Mollisia scopiformis TaxID=149040 RepID=A0A194X3V1_MOLSC|nr:GCN5-related N-acetyltransferase [Mollisia scopiformis]KUJ14846.1 GCN5-related N-acetyltransferase [Mollisia scopiformis]
MTPILQTPTHTFYLRPAAPPDTPALNTMISLSVRTLHTPFYSAAVIDSAMKYVYGVDSLLISDGTYFLISATPLQSPNQNEEEIVAAGSYSFRSTLYGGDQFSARDPTELDPGKDAARLRAMFVHPSFTGLGLAGVMLRRCEGEVRGRGFRRLEFGATYAGVGFYERAGYGRLEEEGVGGKGRCDKVMEDGRVLELVKMGRTF